MTRVVRRKAPSADYSLGARTVDGGLFGTPGTRRVALGIDQSYSGFALTAMALDGTGYFTWLRRLTGFGVTRLQDAQFFLYSVLEVLRSENRPVDRIGIEGYAFSSHQGHSAGELGAAIKLLLADYFGTEGPGPGFPLILPPQLHKKFATGSGAAKKNEMLLKVYKKWDVEFKDDNMADSFSIAQVLRHLDLQTTLLAYEKEVLAKLADPKHREWSPVATAQ